MATPSGTQAYFEKRHPNIPSVRLGKTDFQVAPVGFGTYRTGRRVPEHRSALRHALRSGVNLIDTSPNYQDGDAERLVGEVLNELFEKSELKREEIVVVSKAGYVQGENLVEARARENRGTPFPEMTKLSEDCWHCIHPEFLSAQITETLTRTGLESIDVLLLHNPEYFLQASEDHREYYRRIAMALAQLEIEVTKGRIRHYGISSNTFGDSRESRDFTSLEVVLESAGPHFSVIQFPLNLFEPGPLFEENQSGKTVLELAGVRDLGTLTNRPLNAFLEGKLVRLATISDVREIDVEEDVKLAFLDALRVEESFPATSVENDPPEPAQNDVCWAHILRHHLPKLSEERLWHSVRDHQILPALEGADQMIRGLPPTHPLVGWREKHRPLLRHLFETIDLWVRAQAGTRAKITLTRLRDEVPTLARSNSTLAPTAVRVLRSLPDVHCVLVGMRQVRYVDEMLRLEPVLTPEQAHDALDAAHGDSR